MNAEKDMAAEKERMELIRKFEGEITRVAEAGCLELRESHPAFLWDVVRRKSVHGKRMSKFQGSDVMIFFILLAQVDGGWRGSFEVKEILPGEDNPLHWKAIATSNLIRSEKSAKDAALRLVEHLSCLA